MKDFSSCEIVFECIVPVDYNLAHRQQIAAARVDWILRSDRDLIRRKPTENLFQVPRGQKEQCIKVVTNWSKYPQVSPEDAMTHLKLRPTLSAESLAFAKANLEITLWSPLIGLGSVWVGLDGAHYRLCIYTPSDGRGLCLAEHNGEWQYFNYLGVSIES